MILKNQKLQYQTHPSSSPSALPLSRPPSHAGRETCQWQIGNKWMMSGLAIYADKRKLMVIYTRVIVLFRSHTGLSCITCSYKAGSGMLYPLERGFIFVHKPPVHVRFDEISSVNFARVAGGGGTSRSFDFEVETKSGTTYVFSSIEK